MKEKLKLLLRWAAIFIICFLVIYLVTFFGGWKLFESRDPILVEIGVALVLSIFVFLFLEISTKLEKRVTSLEKRISELEDIIANK